MVAALHWSPAFRERLFTREEYYAMAKAGVLKPDERVELIEGRIVEMFPLGPWHVSSKAQLNRHLVGGYGTKALVLPEPALHLPDDSEPQPDFLVVRLKGGNYREALPRTEDVILLIEVSDTSRDFDLGAKQELYATHRISEYWVVDKELNAVHAFRRPVDGVFSEKTIYRPGESIPLPECEGQALPVSDVV